MPCVLMEPLSMRQVSFNPLLPYASTVMYSTSVMHDPLYMTAVERYHPESVATIMYEGTSDEELCDT